MKKAIIYWVVGIICTVVGCYLASKWTGIGFGKIYLLVVLFTAGNNLPVESRKMLEKLNQK